MELSNEAQEILKEAIKDKNSIVTVISFLNEDEISTNNRQFIKEDHTAKEKSKWKGGVAELERKRLIKDLGKGTTFEVTREGFEYYE